jgi:exosome complex RNA-binding protein Csl4
MDVLQIYPDKDFVTSMQQAWRAARTWAQESLAKGRPGDETTSRESADLFLQDGRWRLMPNDQALPEVSGRSASGAAARGWCFALTGKIPDEGVIVLAQVEDQKNPQLLIPVSGIPKKVKAIAEDEEFQINTIVVTSRENYDEAVATRNALGARAMKITVKLRDDGRGGGAAC